MLENNLNSSLSLLYLKILYMYTNLKSHHPSAQFSVPLAHAHLPHDGFALRKDD